MTVILQNDMKLCIETSARVICYNKCNDFSSCHHCSASGEKDYSYDDEIAVVAVYSSDKRPVLDAFLSAFSFSSFNVSPSHSLQSSQLFHSAVFFCTRIFTNTFFKEEQNDVCLNFYDYLHPNHFA